MGCTSSKRIDVAADVYRPAPASFAVFDISAIEEPWMKPYDSSDQKHKSHVPATILEKLNSIDDSPRTWEEVSKALEDLKSQPHEEAAEAPPAGKNLNFHTVEEVEAKVSGKESKLGQENKPELNKSVSAKKDESRGKIQNNVSNSLKDNIFIKRDKLEREKDGKSAGFVKRDPLSDFEENCPPGGADAIVLYTTSLGGVRRTYEDCHQLRMIMETHRVVFDERDISLHGGFLNELKELLGEGTTVPRLFIKGRYVGGVDEVVHLNETGRLARILNWARVERGVGRLGCEGCGGARFVPCYDCGGSCKVVVGETKERCGSCNENGLAQCPVCI